MRQSSNVTAASQFGLQTSPHNTFNQPTTVTISPLPLNAMNLIPAASYPSIAMTGAPISGTVFASAILPQQQPQPHQTLQQPLVFSGCGGNYFLAQPSSVTGTPLMLAPGQSAPHGAFVVAQSLSAPATSITSAPTQQPTSCIIRLPDGRLVVPAQAPTPIGLSGTRLPGGQPTYFPVLPGAVPSGQNVSLSQQPQLHHPVGTLTPGPGQAFFIQVPSACGGFGGAVFATTAPSSTAASPQAPQTASCGGPTSVPNRHPILVSSPLPTLQPAGVVSNRGAYSVADNRPPCLLLSSASICLPDTRTLQSQSKTCTMDNCVTLLNNVPPVSTAFSGGIAMTRLPNGMYTTVPYCRPQPLVAVDSCVSSGSETSSTPPPHTAGTRKGSNNRSTAKPNTTPNTTSNVLQRLDEQITALQSLPTLSELQATRLKQLFDVRQQLSRTTKTENFNSQLTSSGLSSSNSGVVSITPAARRDILSILGRNNLLPKVNTVASSETFVVEFRLNQHRYQMRLTRQQKVDMERLLFSVNPERQAEILTVLQQEQARISNTRLLLPSPSAPQSMTSVSGSAPSPSFGSNLQSPSVRSQSHPQPLSSVPSIPLHPNAFGTPALRLVAPRPPLPSSNTMVRSAPITMCSTSPVMGVVTALTMPPIAAHGSVFPPNFGGTVSVANTVLPSVSGAVVSAGGLFLSPSLPHAASTFVMQQPFVVPSPITSTTNSGVSAQPSSQPLDTLSIPRPLHVSNDSPTTVQPIRHTFTPSKQALRLSRMRNYLVNDLKCSVERPSHIDANPDDPLSLPSSLQLLEALAPYHVHQDADNTEEALLKVDKVIEDASLYLNERKRRITDAVHTYWYRESMFHLETPLEDRVLVGRMMLELDRDVFEAEKNEFEAALKLLPPIDDDPLCDNKPSDITPNIHCTSSTDITGSASSQLAVSISCNQQASGPRQPREVSYLKHSCSLLPSPWSTLLGPLAYLRPRIFDSNGNATFSSFNFPVLSDGKHDPTIPNPSMSTTAQVNRDMLPNAIPCSTVITNNSDKFSEPRSSFSTNDLDVKEDSSEDAEADLFLGLDTRTSRTGTNEGMMMDVTGLLEEGIVHSSSALRDRTRSVAFDETYDLWQELMREEGIEMDEMRSMSLDICLDGTAVPFEKGCKGPCQITENGPNDQVVEIQHSEDPDLDAAIRSILSPSN